MSVDRRSHPRYPVEFKVRVQPADIGDDFPATAMMLSRTSVQLHCESDLVMTLVKNTQPPYVCNLRFLYGDNQSLLLSAQVLTHRRVSQQHYVLVFLFKGLDELQESALDGLLTDAIPPQQR